MRVKGAVRWLEVALASCFELIGEVGEKLVGSVGGKVVEGVGRERG